MCLVSFGKDSKKYYKMILFDNQHFMVVTKNSYQSSYLITYICPINN